MPAGMRITGSFFNNGKRLKIEEHVLLRTLGPLLYRNINLCDVLFTMEEFIKELPKVELHAHLNGSISEETMRKLLSRRNGPTADTKMMFDKGQTATLEDCFNMFKLIHQVTVDTESVYMVACDVIREFAADNVKYLELRSTPREVVATGMTKEKYIEAILQAMKDCEKENLDIIVKLILAIDRRNGIKVAMETVNLAAKYRESSAGRVVGIDLSGDPKVGDGCDFIPAFQAAKAKGLRLALHLAEVPAVEETKEILQIVPDRIGHGTCLHTEAGGSQDLVDLVTHHQIPIELCLTSNVIGQTVPHFDNHQFKFWYAKNHPCVICTDDKGVFNTTLSNEYSIASRTFSLDERTLYQLSLQSIQYIFADDTVKADLKSRWKTWEAERFPITT